MKRRCLEENESATHVLRDCEATAHLWFHHLGQFLMEPGDYYDIPISKVLHCILSVDWYKVDPKGKHNRSVMVAVQGRMQPVPYTYIHSTWVQYYLRSSPTSSWRTSRRWRSTGLPKSPSVGHVDDSSSDHTDGTGWRAFLTFLTTRRVSIRKSQSSPLRPDIASVGRRLRLNSAQ
jgi:hypothetical protein